MKFTYKQEDRIVCVLDWQDIELSHTKVRNMSQKQRLARKNNQEYAKFNLKITYVSPINRLVLVAKL